MRAFLSLIFGVCAVLATLVTVPAMWASHNIADENGYVAFTEPIVRDAKFHRVLADALADTLVQDSQVPAELQPVAKAAIVRIAGQVAADPGFLTAWEATQRQSHQIMLGDPRDLPAGLDASQGFAIDLAPLGTYVVDKVNKDLPFAIPAPTQATIQATGTRQTQTLDRLRESPSYARKGLIATAVAALLALAFARRRSVAVAWLGLGAVVAAGLLEVVAVVGVPEVVDRNTAPTPFGKALLDVFVTRADDSFTHWLVVLAIGGGVAAVAGGASRLVLSGRGQNPTNP